VKRAVRRTLRLTSAGLGLSLLLYLGTLLHPQPLFAYQARRAEITVYATHPIPEAIQPILARVEERISTSPLRDPRVAHRVFLCDDERLFAWFASYKHRVGAVTYDMFNGNIFLRPSHLEANRLVGPSGREVPGERTLDYFLAHEITHHMASARLGRLPYWRLQPWQREGYADYIARGRGADIAAYARRTRAGAVEMDPLRSGLYLRYHMLVAYLLDVRGMEVSRLLAGPLEAAPIEREILDRYRLAPPGGP
jgi:hypothetical protein